MHNKTNENNGKKLMRESYMVALESRDQAEAAMFPNEKVEYLEAALANLLELVERMSLFSAAVAANSKSIVRGVETVAKSNAGVSMLLADQSRGLGRLLSFHKMIQHQLAEEAEFADCMHRMVCNKMLEGTGVDPMDEVAVVKHFHEISRAFVLPPGQN